MDDQWRLPETIELGGEEYDIRTDFRAILDILKAMADPELSDSEKAEVMIKILYWDYEEIPVELLDEAAQKGKEFIDCGITGEGKSKVQLMDWEQDSPIIAPAVNKNIGKDIRSLKYMHWWTFLGAYMEIADGLFSQVLYIRQKKAKGKKLEKWEMEFYKNNKKLIDLKQTVRKRSAEEEAALNELFGIKK